MTLLNRFVAPLLLLTMTAASACMTIYGYHDESSTASRKDQIEQHSSIVCGTCSEWLAGLYPKAELCTPSSAKSNALIECELTDDSIDCCIVEQDDCANDDGVN